MRRVRGDLHVILQGQVEGFAGRHVGQFLLPLVALLERGVELGFVDSHGFPFDFLEGTSLACCVA
jgi:hypothetical protein